MPTTIITSASATATAYSNQRKIDRTSNGVLWAVRIGGTTGKYEFSYSVNDGQSWTLDSAFVSGTNGVANYVPNGSFFIDQDDYAHFVYKDSDLGYIYYRRGTPNAGRTAWTWSAATLVLNNPEANYPDIVAHREGTGWVAHVIGSLNLANNYRAWYYPVTITSGGSITVGTVVALASSSYGNSNHTFPSIDFNHNGDGKTVAGSTPHLYAAWSAGATGTGNGIRFRKATYSGGSWTWGTEREIDSTRYVADTSYWLNCMFDGNRVVIGGYIYGTSSDLVLYDRDAEDTTTTSRTLVAAITNATVPSTGSCSYDSNGNVYFAGLAFTTPRSIGYRKWTRATNTVSTFTTTDADAPGSGVSGYVSAKRGYSNSRIEFIYTDGTASPYSVTYDSIFLNQAPTVTLNTVGTFDPRAAKTISWTFSDPDAGTTQTAYELDYRVPGGTWASLSTGTTASSYNVPANFFADETNYEIRVRVNDGTVWSAYDTKTFYTDSWTYYPEVTAAYRDGVLSLKPSVYYRLGESSGTVAYDEVSGQNGEHRTAVTLGQAGALAVSNTAAKYPNGNASPGNTRIPKRIGPVGSISMWVDTTSWASDNLPHGVFQSGDHTTTNYAGWLALFRWQGADMVNSPFYFRIVNDAGVLKDLAMNWQTYFGTTLGWHQITATWGNGSMALYVDDTQVAARGDLGTYSGDQSVNNSAYSLIGLAHLWSGNGTTIDEVAVFDKVLTQTEITNLYSLRTSVSDSSPAYADIIKADGPVGYWRLGETSGTVAVDSSGNGNNATYRSGVTLNSTPLINNDSNPATDVGSSSNGIATVPSKLGLDGRDETVELWVKTPAAVTRGGFVYVGSSGYGIGLGSGSFDSNGWSLLGLFEVLRWIDTGYVMSPSTTYHVVITLNASGFPTVFVNGSQVYTDTAGAPQAPGGTGFIDIGHSGGRALQAGTLDEVAVYNRALSAAEIKRHYDAGKGIAINSKTTISTATLDPDSDYEVQVKVSDGFHYSAWSPSADLVFTRHYVYEGGVWKASQKQQYWINDWRNGDATNF